jgi:hypothetical protein
MTETKRVHNISKLHLLSAGKKIGNGYSISRRRSNGKQPPPTARLRPGAHGFICYFALSMLKLGVRNKVIFKGLPVSPAPSEPEPSKHRQNIAPAHAQGLLTNEHKYLTGKALNYE